MENLREEFELRKLRIQRRQECYPYINRGAIWYMTLTDVQVEELRAWYNAWLNVTETKVIPVKPDWLS